MYTHAKFYQIVPRGLKIMSNFTNWKRMDGQTEGLAHYTALLRSCNLPQVFKFLTSRAVIMV